VRQDRRTKRARANVLQPRIAGLSFRGTGHTLGTQESHKSQQTEGLLVSDSQSTSIHQTAIGGEQLIKSTWCENPFPSLGVIDHFLQADLTLPITLIRTWG
jgi:hypothetical protein